jgi:hypothetical protein
MSLDTTSVQLKQTLYTFLNTARFVANAHSENWFQLRRLGIIQTLPNLL